MSDMATGWIAVLILVFFGIGAALGFLIGRLHADVDLLERPASDAWTTSTEYAPQRDERLDDIVDPRQTARDSATSARSKTFRG